MAHMAENLMGSIDSICGSNASLSRFDLGLVSTNISDPIDGVLPSAGFPYHDIFGRFLFVFSPVGYVICLSLMHLVMVVFILRRIAYLERQDKLELARYCGILLVHLAFSSFLVFLLSRFKASLNLGSSYGMPLLNLSWTVFAVVAVFCYLANFLGRRQDENHYTSVPADDEEPNDPLTIAPPDSLLVYYASFIFWALLTGVIVLPLACVGYFGGYFLSFWFLGSSGAVLLAEFFRWCSRESWSALSRDEDVSFVYSCVVELEYVGIFCMAEYVPLLLSLDVFEQVVLLS